MKTNTVIFQTRHGDLMTEELLDGGQTSDFVLRRFDEFPEEKIWVRDRNGHELPYVLVVMLSNGVLVGAASTLRKALLVVQEDAAAYNAHFLRVQRENSSWSSDCIPGTNYWYQIWPLVGE
jgi:hypothetical protein